MKTHTGKGVVLWMTVTGALAALIMLLAAPSEARGQVRVGISVDWWDRVGDVRVQGRVDYGRTEPLYRDHGYVHPPVVRVDPIPARPRARGERGPAFCRSGAGHPVHGWSWCVRKGFAGPYHGREVRGYDRYDRYEEYDRYEDYDRYDR